FPGGQGQAAIPARPAPADFRCQRSVQRFSFAKCRKARRPASLVQDPPLQRRLSMTYVDGFILAVPKAKMSDYKAMAELGRTVWMEHGAIGYAECEGDDVPYGEVTSFPRAVQATDNEVVILSWIVFSDRAAR